MQVILRRKLSPERKANGDLRAKIQFENDGGAAFLPIVVLQYSNENEDTVIHELKQIMLVL